MCWTTIAVCFRELLAHLLWLLWKSRNDVKFNGGRQDFYVILLKAVSLALDHQEPPVSEGQHGQNSFCAIETTGAILAQIKH